MKSLLTKIKTITVVTASLFTLAATANALQNNKSQHEAAYLVQGASNATMTSLVQNVGGEVIHNFSVIQAISAELNEDQVKQISEMNPLVRFTNKDVKAESKDETAGVIWGRHGGRVETAGVIWGRHGGRVETAGVIWGRHG
ncbi:hypothetical protein KO525_17345, partial [Psychrosphaera sp. B3R10]